MRNYSKLEVIHQVTLTLSFIMIIDTHFTAGWERQILYFYFWILEQYWTYPMQNNFEIKNWLVNNQIQWQDWMPHIFSSAYQLLPGQCDARKRHEGTFRTRKWIRFVGNSKAGEPLVLWRRTRGRIVGRSSGTFPRVSHASCRANADCNRTSGLATRPANGWKGIRKTELLLHLEHICTNY